MSRRSAAAFVALLWNQVAAHVHLRIRFADLAKLTSHMIQSRRGDLPELPGKPCRISGQRSIMEAPSVLRQTAPLFVRAPTHWTCMCERLQENVESELQPFADPRRKFVLGWFTGLRCCLGSISLGSFGLRPVFGG